jgi:urea transport system permease protein
MKKRLKIATDLALLLVLAFAPYFLSAYHLSLLGRFLAMAILSLGISITWGRAGILSLGQGVFWGLGAYVLAMHLKLAALAPGDMPDFMMWSGLDHLPAWWNIFRNPAVALTGIIIVPTVTAGAMAWLVFNRRVSGVYFALLTQALALVFSTLLISEQAYTGGFNGLTDFNTILGHDIIDPGFQRALYWITLAALALAFVFCRWLLGTGFGKVLLAVRDGESRVRFLGYSPAAYKTVAFALAGVISPAMVGVVPSIEMVIAVAVGGRASLTGVVLGTLLVNFGKDTISSAIPELWQFVIGALFILVVTVLPKGLVSLPGVAHRIKSMVFKSEAVPALEGPNV